MSDQGWDTCVFRYRYKTTNAVDALLKNRLFFSIPAKFNDPFDNDAFINYQQLYQDIIINLKIGMDDYLELHKKDMLPLHYNVVTYLWNQNRMNAVTNYLYTVYNACENVKSIIRENVKMICFSYDYENILMWSHYASYHEGFCLVYEKDAILKGNIYDTKGLRCYRKLDFVDVDYSQTRLDFTNEMHYCLLKNSIPYYTKPDFIDIPNKRIKDFLKHKSNVWDYEKEIRLIPHVNDLNTQCSLSYIEVKPKAIILGCKSTDVTIVKPIVKYCLENGIKLFRMLPEDNKAEFKLTLNEIPYEEYDYILRAKYLA